MVICDDFKCNVCHVIQEHLLDKHDPQPEHCQVKMTKLLGGMKRYTSDTYTSSCGDVFKEKTKHWYEPHKGLEGIDLPATRENKI
jgi:hypothetical protein